MEGGRVGSDGVNFFLRIPSPPSRIVLAVTRPSNRPSFLRQAFKLVAFYLGEQTNRLFSIKGLGDRNIERKREIERERESEI